MNMWWPIGPKNEWHFRQSIDYSITANYAVLDFASRYRETLLYNIYVMGRNSIARGSTDTWTDYPSRVAAVKTEIDRQLAGAATTIVVRTLASDLGGYVWSVTLGATHTVRGGRSQAHDSRTVRTASRYFLGSSKSQ